MRQSLIKPALGGLALAALLAALLAAAFAAQPLSADVAAGADAWSRGDYAAAVREWEGPAAGGDPEAMFHLAQAYRLGRGVPADTARAELLYARAAAAGHTQAADTYGLLLFELGRREAAVPYLQGAARHGDPRAQYLLGIAYFNGDFVEVDWLRAYALMTLAKAAGLPQAAPALAQMDGSVPAAQRVQAASLAERLRTGAEDAWGMAAAKAEPAAPQPASEGRWRLQLGAFSVASNAAAQAGRLKARPELAGAQLREIPSGRLTLLQAAGFPSREAAAAACAGLKRSGIDCLVSGG